MEKYLVSACLLGINCKYDGTNNYNENIMKLIENEQIIPICPEQLGGLSTPRAPSEINTFKKVINNKGKDVTNNYVKGSLEALEIAKKFNIKKAILKSKSPSCGYGEIYDGTFTKTKVKGNGTTVQLFLDNGIEVFTEETFNIEKDYSKNPK